MNIKNEKTKKQKDSPNSLSPPYHIGLLLGLLLHYVKPLRILESDALLLLGVSLIIISLVLFAVSLRSFAKANTSIDPRKETTFIVSSGPYKFSRNPIYLSYSILYLGITAFFNDFWFLILLVPILIIVHYGVIKREEYYLTKKFGEKYIKHKKSVRRWM